MPSVIIAATHPLQPTGYARVGCVFANGLCALGWDVTYYGYQNLAPVSKRYLDPKIRVIDVAHRADHPESFGTKEFPDVLEHLNPDVVLIYNDIMVINEFLNVIPDTQKIVTYVDIVHDGENASLIQTISTRSEKIMVFSQHWANYFPAEKTSVIPHGVDTTTFHVKDQKECRRALGLPDHGFLVLNTNRNSYRKALDVTIRVFLEIYAAEGSPDDMYLFLNCNTHCESGYNIPEIIQYECMRLGLDTAHILSTKILGMPNSGFLSDEVLNDLYNASDVMMNTCVGEGFGLPQLEGKMLGIPQIVNATGGLKDICDDAIPPIESLHMSRGFIVHGGVMDIPDSKRFCERLREYYAAWHATGTVREQGVLKDTFEWPRILADVHSLLI
jgi:glycosyltransferase involved in cell wall biosynthesis